MKAVMDDKIVLHEVEASGRRAPNGPDEQQQYHRLISEGLLRRVPVSRTPGDYGDPLVCELTERGRQRLHGDR
jgi:hypothetical protein